jgi:hypothetical protein
LLAAYASGERSFTYWNLNGLDLRAATLRDANFYGANLTGADLSGADLTRANFGQASLRAAILRGANISEAYFEGASTDYADMTDAITDQPTSDGADLASPAVSVSLNSSPAPASAPALRFCVYCGSGMPTEGTFCPVCGKSQPPVESAATSSPVVQPQPVAPVSPYGVYTPPAAPTTVQAQSPDSTQLGKLLREYPGSGLRFVGIALWAGVAVFGLIASLTESSFIGFLFWLVVGAGCFVYYYNFQRDVHAEIYEYGFSISRGDKTTRSRWEGITNVEHWVKQSYLYGFIPLGKSHSYTITLSTGEQVKVTSSLTNAQQLGEVIHQMWIISPANRGIRTS